VCATVGNKQLDGHLHRGTKGYHAHLGGRNRTVSVARQALLVHKAACAHVSCAGRYFGRQLHATWCLAPEWSAQRGVRDDGREQQHAATSERRAMGAWRWSHLCPFQVLHGQQ
jgi:hypothetical protein